MAGIAGIPPGMPPGIAGIAGIAGIPPIGGSEVAGALVLGSPQSGIATGCLGTLGDVVVVKSCGAASSPLWADAHGEIAPNGGADPICDGPDDDRAFRFSIAALAKKASISTCAMSSIDIFSRIPPSDTPARRIRTYFCMCIVSVELTGGAAAPATADADADTDVDAALALNISMPGRMKLGDPRRLRSAASVVKLGERLPRRRSLSFAGDLSANDLICCLDVGVASLDDGGLLLGGVGSCEEGDSPLSDPVTEPVGDVRRECPGVPRDRGVFHCSFDDAFPADAGPTLGIVTGEGRNFWCGSGDDGGVRSAPSAAASAATTSLSAPAATTRCPSGTTTTRCPSGTSTIRCPFRGARRAVS